MANEPDGRFEESTTVILNKIAAGERRALEELVYRYNPKMLRMAERCLQRSRRHIVTCDADDAVNGALAKLYQRAVAGELPCVGSSVEFWKLFFSMFKDEVRGALDHDGAIKRGGPGARRSRQRSRDGDALGENARRRRETLSLHYLSPDQVYSLLPPPQDLVLIGLEIDEFLENLDDPLTHRIAMLRLESYTSEEIGELLELSERTIERKLAAIRTRFVDYLAGSSGG